MKLLLSISLFLISLTCLSQETSWKGGYENGLYYRYYEAGNYSTLPDFNLVPKTIGTIANFTIPSIARSEIFAVNYTGFINIDNAGTYTFYISSDDGSNLLIDGKLIINNDGLHSSAEKSGSIKLTAGKHIISVGYFQMKGDKVLKVMWQGPGISKQVISNNSLWRLQ